MYFVLWEGGGGSYMSIENDLATEATPSFTCSITEGASSECAVVVVEGAGSPANLDILRISTYILPNTATF